MEFIQTNQAAQPLGHYSQAVKQGNIVYISGQLPITKEGTMITGDIKEQTLAALANLEAILKEAGSSKNKVLKTTIFISDISLWAEANEAYASFFGEHKPARSAVPTKDLPRGFLIEIESIATI